MRIIKLIVFFCFITKLCPAQHLVVEMTKDTFPKAGVDIIISDDASLPFEETWGVRAINNANSGFGGEFFGRFFGLYGQSTSGFGVGGRSETHRGVSGSSDTGSGVVGESETGIGVYARSSNNSAGFFSSGVNSMADIILGGTSGANDNGIISSDPDRPSSDMIIRANDDIAIQLDRDDDDSGELRVQNGSGTIVSTLDEFGNLDLNGFLSADGLLANNSYFAPDRSFDAGVRVVMTSFDAPREISPGIYAQHLSPGGTAGWFRGGRLGITARSTNGDGLEAISTNGYGIKAFSSNAIAGFFDSGLNRADIVLGAFTTSYDNGVISSDPEYSSSDIVIEAYDDVSIHLDENNDEDGQFRVQNGSGTVIFRLFESGNLNIAGSLNQGSDRNRKEEVIPIDTDDILSKVSSLPLYEWQYKCDDRRHIGPMAQDFHKTFQLGDDDTTISSIDADGVALAAIQALYEIIEKQSDEMKLLKEDVSQLKDKLKLSAR